MRMRRNEKERTPTCVGGEQTGGSKSLKTSCKTRLARRASSREGTSFPRDTTVSQQLLRNAIACRTILAETRTGAIRDHDDDDGIRAALDVTCRFMQYSYEQRSLTEGR